LIKEHNGVHAGSNFRCDFLEMKLHGLRCSIEVCF
jgi:hypothetical protein